MRFKGSHNYKAIAEHLNSAHNRYGLSSKNIVFTVTDNAANMVKCFKELGIDSQPQVIEDDEVFDSDDEHDIQVESITDLVVESTDNDFELPQHVRCASHTLNLIVSADIGKAISTKRLSTYQFDRVYRTAMARCSHLWNFLNR